MARQDRNVMIASKFTIIMLNIQFPRGWINCDLTGFPLFDVYEITFVVIKFICLLVIFLHPEILNVWRQSGRWNAKTLVVENNSGKRRTRGYGLDFGSRIDLSLALESKVLHTLTACRALLCPSQEMKTLLSECVTPPEANIQQESVLLLEIQNEISGWYRQLCSTDKIISSITFKTLTCKSFTFCLSHEQYMQYYVYDTNEMFL